MSVQCAPRRCQQPGLVAATGLARALFVAFVLLLQPACGKSQPPAHADRTATPVTPANGRPTSPPVDSPANETAAIPVDPTAGSAGTPLPAPDPPTMPTTPPAPPPAPAPAPPAEPVTIVIHALSRGKGVPTQTRDTYKQIHALLEQRRSDAAITRLESSRMGLEGETRLCVEFSDRDHAAAMLAEIGKLAAGTDLLNIVEGPCPGNKGSKP